jgi:membrane protein
MNTPGKRASDALRRFYRFATYEIWQIGTPGEEVPRGLIIKQIRVAILLGSKLVDGMHMVRAAALTFATLLSIVPFLAMLFFVIQEFNLSDNVYAFVKDRMVSAAERFAGESEEPSASVPPEAAPSDWNVEASPGGEMAIDKPSEIAPVAAPPAIEESPESQELRREILDFIFQGVTSKDEGTKDPVEAISTTADEIAELASQAANNRAAMLTSGVILILTAVFGLMRNIENAFNRTWGVRRTKPWYRTLFDYAAVIVLTPFIVAAAMGVLIAVRSQAFSEALGPLSFALSLAQHVLVVLVFTLLYRFVPHTRVQFKFALLAGLIAGTLWVLLSWGYVQFQFGLARYAVILSAFAQFPMLLMWVYFSWAIVLLGCEIAYAYQNESTFALERYADEANYAYREAVGLRAMVEIGFRFDRGLPGLTVEDAAREWNVPMRLLANELEALVTAGLVAARATEPIEYQPARPLERISARDVVHTLRRAGTEPSKFREDPRFRKMFNELERATGDFADATLADLVEGYSASLEQSGEPARSLNG